MLRIRDRARTVFGLDAVKLILIRTTLDLTLGLCQRLAAMQRLRLVAALRGRQTEADGPPSAVRVHWQGQYVEGVGAEPQPAVVTVTATGLEIRTVAGATRWWPFHQVRRTPDADGAVRLQRHVTAPEALVVPDPAFLQAIRTAGPRAVRRRVLRPGRRGMRV